VRSWYKPSIKINRISPITITLDKDVEVTDKFSTKLAKEQAKQEAIRNIANKEIFELDKTAQEESFNKLKFAVKVIRNTILGIKPEPDPINPKINIEAQNFFLSINDVKFNELLLANNIKDLLASETFYEDIKIANDSFSPDIASDITRLNEIELKYFFSELSELRKEIKYQEKIKKELDNSFFEQIKQTDYESIFRQAFLVQKKLLDLGIVRGLPKQKVIENITILFPNIPKYNLNLISKLINLTTLPNVQIDWQKINLLEEEAMNNVQPILTELKSGSILAKKGDYISEQNYYYLKDLNMLNPKTDWAEIRENLAILVIITLLILILALFNKNVNFAVNRTAMLIVVPVAVAAIIAPLGIWGVDKLALAPIATISILLSIFYSPFMGFLAVTIVSFFLAKTMDMNFWQVLPQYFGSISAILLTRNVHQREDLTNAGTKIAIVQVSVFLLTIMIAVEDFKVTTVLIVASLYAVGAIASGFISLAALPYLESGLKLITPFKLAELSNPNQTLLKKLKKEAPGTYEHSLNVSRLSEEASNSLNLNTELIRVGLLYHDIGKMHAPDYFIENTLGKPNPHTTLDDPIKSAEIIIAHVPEGIKMAKKYNLPAAIIDFIPMHQGTTVTNYFYFKAIENLGEKNVDKELFRYPGPKPNSKETGVAMIADSSEAALRSIKDIADEEKAETMIRKIVNSRWEEGELSESGLTKADLEQITKSFLKVWRSQNHERVKYPEQKQEDASDESVAA
jgi:cyclic-di-AMP phosphodiesterase PgpH